MKRAKLILLVVLAFVVLAAAKKIKQRFDLMDPGSYLHKLFMGGLLAAAAVLAFPFIEFWPAVAIAGAILAATGALHSIGKAFSSECPDGLTKDDDSDVCLGITGIGY